MSIDWLSVATALTSTGKLTPFHAIAQVYSNVEVRTAFSPPVSVDVARLDESAEPPSLPVKVLLGVLRPTVVLTGPAGTKVVAPAGEASRNGAAALAVAVVAAVGLLVGTGVAVGYAMRGEPE